MDHTPDPKAAGTTDAAPSKTATRRKEALAHSHDDKSTCWMCTRGRCVHCKSVGDPSEAFPQLCNWCYETLTDGGRKPLTEERIADTGKHDYRQRKVKDEKYRDVGFPRPVLGVGDQARKVDEYIARRRKTDLAGTTCNADRFCNGKVVAYKLCGSHLRVAAKAGSFGENLQKLAAK